MATTTMDETGRADGLKGALASLVQDLSSDQEQMVLRVFRQRSFDTGASVLKEGDYPDFVYIVKTGSARVFKRIQRGNESTLFMAGPGESFGFESLFSDLYERTVTAIEELTVVYSPRDTILHLMETIPQFAINVSRLLTICIRKMEDRVVSFSGGALQRRLVLALMKLAETGEKSAEGTKLAGVTHEFLSSVVGASREAVTLALKKLKESGAIQQQGKGNLTVRPEILLRLSETD